MKIEIIKQGDLYYVTKDGKTSYTKAGTGRILNMAVYKTYDEALTEFNRLSLLHSKYNPVGEVLQSKEFSS